MFVEMFCSVVYVIDQNMFEYGLCAWSQYTDVIGKNL